MTQRDRFLPVNLQDLKARGWAECDFVFVSGDAYVDHPAFAAAVIGRLLESQGFKVGILAQPDLANPASLEVLGRPRLGFLVGAGAMDSMVNHYTAAKKPRSDDAYTPGGKAGKRPDRAVIQYVNAIKARFKDAPVIIGGIEASLRRLTHYDYWSDTVKRSVLMDSKADLLVYGMGETQIMEIARRLAAGEKAKEMEGIRGTVRIRGKRPPEAEFEGSVVLPSHEEQAADKKTFARAFALSMQETDPGRGRKILLPDTAGGDCRWVVQETPALPLEQSALDAVYQLPYTREAHPDHTAAGGVPALEEVKFSLVSSRGCFGSCSFCAITYHQGRVVRGRSVPSLLAEAGTLTRMRDFKGNIHDVGGPTANFFGPACALQAKGSACADKACLGESPCKQLKADHSDYLALLRKLRALPGVKKVFIRSGLRFDFIMQDKDDAFLRELCEHHISGRLKVAPEHVSDKVLGFMGKPPHRVYEAFVQRFDRINSASGKNQYVVPYFFSSHPGAGLAEAIEMAVWLKRSGHVPDSVQDFYPTPGTLSTCMFHTGLDPRTMEPVFVAKGEKEKALQRALLQFDRKENEKLVREALRQAGREDLIGKGPDCLLRY